MTLQLNTMIENQGQIRSMELPPTWQLLDSHVPAAASPSYVRFGPVNVPQVELIIYHAQRPLPREVQESLQSILAAKENLLTKSQIDSLSVMLREASLQGAFNFLSARSQDWNGKKVILVEGRWNDTQQDRFWMFIPDSAECESVQEVWFQAPVAQYPAHLKQARQAINSIRWA
ncbi:MAG TPA: hypothetical protein V6C89_04580 [Drouetiella sp.]|jgi:hypothetical protein